VILADDYCVNTEGDSVLAQMVKLYDKYQCSIVAIMEVPEENVHRYGVIEGEEEEDGIFRISSMVEKPAREDAPTNLAIIGRYILTPDIYELIEKTPPGKNGEMQITDALMAQAKQGKVIGYRFKGRRFDCGSVDGFIEATNFTYELQNS
jgi:UTP--glucose-1-phosphate uridylyltransferase